MHFSGCENLSSVEIPASLTHIGDSAFERCVSLCSIVIPDGVNFVGKSAFISCVSLEKINIPSKVKTLSAHVFHQCIRLEMVLLLVVQVYLLLNLKIQQIGILQKIQITKVVKHLILLKMLVA